MTLAAIGVYGVYGGAANPRSRLARGRAARGYYEARARRSPAPRSGRRPSGGCERFGLDALHRNLLYGMSASERLTFLPVSVMLVGVRATSLRGGRLASIRVVLRDA